MEGKQYGFIVDHAGRTSSQHPPGSQPIVCIDRELFNDLPDGTPLYGHSGQLYYKGQGEMAAWQQGQGHPELNITSYGATNFGFLATDDDLQHSAAFMGPYRDS